MDSILLKILSWWIPKRRYSMWHCNVLELLIAAWLFLFLPSFTYPILYSSPNTPEEQNNLDIPQTFTTEIFKKDSPDDSHPVVRLVQTRNWTFIGLGFYMACILAPMNEELLFRAGLQNCLQGFLTQLFKKRRIVSLQTCRWVISSLSIVLPALFFALVHYRSDDVANQSIERIVRAITNACVAWTIFPIICYFYIFFIRRIRFRDMFGTLREFPGLALFGIKWFWIIVPTYLLSFVLVFIRVITNAHFIPDPFALIPLALVFGFLYYRTQSVLPSIILHMLFNFTSLCMVLLPFLL